MDVYKINQWANSDTRHLQYLFELSHSASDAVAFNALWCMTHLGASNSGWLQSLQSDLIDMLLVERHVGKRRMLLQLLRNQSYSPDNIRTDFLDFCFSRINAESEPYAIRAFSIYCAFNVCKYYPELLAELNEHLNMLEYQPLSAGLVSALRQTRKNVTKCLSTH